MSELIQQRHILVTGASSGIGKAICEKLLASGARVLGVARDLEKFQPEHAAYTARQVDLSDLSSLEKALKDLAKSFPDIDGVVCCAGAGQFGSLEEFSFTQIRSLIDLNLTSQIYVARQFIPQLKRHALSDMVFIGSEAALSGGRRGAVYSASKAALRGFAQALRDESAKAGMRVSVINPGMVKTPFFDDLSFTPGDHADNYIEPEDVAEAVAMVMSARAGTVFDEINLSPQKKVIQFRKPGSESNSE